MQAKVPIVPIVIKNAHHALPKGSSLVRPTTIEVVVLDPIDLSNWKRKNLDKNIDKVRNMFLHELNQNE
jgi:putative phosphoserine phosphatase/1-acylglycerol-3-phosphate O-acyltransferase